MREIISSVVSGILRISGSSGHSSVTSQLQPAKTNKKTTVVFHRPSDGKVSFFWKTESQDSRYLNQEYRTSFGVILFSFMEGERGSIFHGKWTISSHKGRGRWLSFQE